MDRQLKTTFYMFGLTSMAFFILCPQQMKNELSIAANLLYVPRLLLQLNSFVLILGSLQLFIYPNLLQGTIKNLDKLVNNNLAKSSLITNLPQFSMIFV